MEPSFVRSKFNMMLGVSTVTMSINFAVMLSAALIAGNLVGPDGLSGVNVCSPAFGVGGFMASLLSVGAGLVFSQAMGAFEERRANGVFTQSLVISALFSFVIGIAMVCGGEAFMNFSGVTGEVRRQALSFWRWQIVAMPLTPFVLLLEALVWADGDGVIATAAGVCHVIGSIGLSILFTKLMGTAGGVGAGTSLTMVLVLLVVSLHFLRANNHLKLVRYWSWKDLRSTLSGSLPDASIYLCWAILIMIINKLVVVCYPDGLRLLAVVALAGSVTEFSIVFDGVGEALIPLGGMYAGEGNHPALRRLANHSALVATAEGVVCGVLFYLFAPCLAPVFGIRGDSADLLPVAAETIRAMGFAMPFMGFLMMANTHYLIVRHKAFAVSVTFVKDLIFPCLCALALGRENFVGIWWGIALGYALAAAYPFVYVWLRHGRSQFPWLIPADDGKILDFSIWLTPEGVSSARDRIEGYLSLHKIPDATVKRVMFAVEETGIMSAKKQADAKMLAEYAIFVDHPGVVRLITRDMSRAFDVNRLTPYIARIAERRYLNTLNCNRSEYIFRY